MNIPLLNPARDLKVEEAMKVAELLPEYKKVTAKTDISLRWRQNLAKHFIAIRLLQSFESLLELKLEKGHFVCEVKKPVRAEYPVNGADWLWDDACKIYHNAERKVLFDGFEKSEEERFYKSSRFFIDRTSFCLWLHNGVKLTGGIPINPTIGDLLTEIERYNRTSSTPIELLWTKNLLTYLKIKG